MGVAGVLIAAGHCIGGSGRRGTLVDRTPFSACSLEYIIIGDENYVPFENKYDKYFFIEDQNFPHGNAQNSALENKY